MYPAWHPDVDPATRTQVGEFHKPMYQSVIKKEGGAVGAGLRAAADASLSDDYVSPPKYKSSLLHRYLNDSLRHVMVANGVMDARRRNHSGSFSSNEYDEDLLSPSSSEAEANFIYRTGELLPVLHSFLLCVCVSCSLRGRRASWSGFISPVSAVWIHVWFWLLASTTSRVTEGSSVSLFSLTLTNVKFKWNDL